MSKEKQLRAAIPEKHPGTCGSKLSIKIVKGIGALVKCPNRSSEILLPDEDITYEKAVEYTCSTCRLLKKGLVQKKTATDEEKRNNFINLQLF